tara:strand:+ start:333 stop:599 length:267 start_codon:yes stop_codon:yes gene_type:complete
MNEEEKEEKLLTSLSTSILNQLSISGIIEAAKNYSIQLAKDQLGKMSKEDKITLMENIEKAEAEAEANQKAAQASKEEVEVAETEVVA